MASPTSTPVEEPNPSPKTGHRQPSTNHSVSFSASGHTRGTNGPTKHSRPASQLAGIEEPIRRPSVQFLGQGKKGLPSTERRSGSLPRRRMSSPPPPAVFQNRVSFDTFEKKYEGLATSFTLVKKHKDYEYTRQTRTFLCGIDDNDYSEYALEWLIDELVDDGDEIVCLRVVEKDSSVAGTTSIEEGKYRLEAERAMKFVKDANHENKAINIIVEFAVGKVEKVITSMIKLYEPAILIVGTRGRTLKGFQGLLPGSVSKFCLQNSPIPVIVVRPNSQRARTKRKRQKDPSRHGYKDLLDKAGADASDIFEDVNEEGAPASDDEAAAVAAAIGIKTSREAKGSPLVKMQSAGAEEGSLTGAVSDRDMSPDELQLRRASTTSGTVDEKVVDVTKTAATTIQTAIMENGVNAEDKSPES